MPRRRLDQYSEPPDYVRALLDRGLSGTSRILDPCAGPEQTIVRQLRASGYDAIAGDVDVKIPDLTLYGDAERTVGACAGWTEWIVTNPPFNEANRLVPFFVASAPHVAVLLRLSWLEPTQDRGDWLHAHPPDGLIVLPRHSFTGNGKVDSVTTAWMIWSSNPLASGIRVAPPKLKRQKGILSLFSGAT